MTNKIRRLIKRMTEDPFPNDGSLYDLGDGNLYQTEDGYTFHAVGDISLLQNGCSNGVCSTALEVPTTTTTTSNDLFADIVDYTDIADHSDEIEAAADKLETEISVLRVRN